MALTHLKGLKITSSDGLIATAAAGVTIGTATITTGTLTTGTLTTGTVTTLTSTTASLTNATVGALAVSSAANAMCGRRYIATAGTGKFHIGTTKAKDSSRILLTVQKDMGNNNPHTIAACVATIASGNGFSVRYSYGATPTGATGTVTWFLVNK